jgi:tetratricopeptide repeat protein
MADNERIEDLRRRVRKDPASMAFGPLAEELRRAGRWREAVGVCRTGLASHPDYLSARVTLGQALLALDNLDDAQRELEHVLSTAPENLVATRALAEISARRAATPAQDTDPAVGPASSVAAPHLTTESTETTEITETPKITRTTEITEIIEIPETTETSENGIFSATSVAAPGLTTTESTEIPETAAVAEAPVTTEAPENGIFSVTSVDSVVEMTPPQKSAADEVESLRMARTLAALESWLAAVYVTRAERRA